MSDKMDKIAKLIVFMIDNGFSKEETKAATNAVRILWNYEMISEILYEPTKEREQ